ncbi:hypothetical protein RB195_019337 [Necator americanus]|uniref:Uncharacterized protein n=1 Tax=Necator americanus TaxID=51031 RepID=A0ABR1CDP3_NECAM
MRTYVCYQKGTKDVVRSVARCLVMGQRSVYDPRDPWAFRNTWTGEIRNSYDDLWIWATLIIALTIIAVCILVPVLIHIYCRDACFRFDSCRCFEQLLTVCYTTSWEKRERSRRRRRATTDYSLRIEESISRKVPKTVQLRNFAPYWQMVYSDPIVSPGVMQLTEMSFKALHDGWMYGKKINI